MLLFCLVWVAMSALVTWPYAEIIENIKKPIDRVIARMVFAVGGPVILLAGLVFNLLDLVMPEGW